jgi:hypothetical protein
LCFLSHSQSDYLLTYTPYEDFTLESIALARLNRDGRFGMIKGTDYEICADAIRKARRLLSEYINPCSPSDSIAAIAQLIDILDDEAVEAALNRIDGRNHFGLVWAEPDVPPTDQ